MNKNALNILIISNNLWSLAEGMFGPLFAVFADKIGGDIFDITWAWAAYLVARGTVSVLTGKISDKWISKEKLVVIGFGLHAIFTFSFLLVSNKWELALVQLGLGFATALASPTWYSLFARYSGNNKNGSAWGVVNGLEDYLAAIGIITGGILVAKFGFTGLFVVMGVVQTLATLYQAKMLK